MINLPDNVSHFANPPISNDQLAQIQRDLNSTLPSTFLEFLNLTNGLSIDGGVLIYGSEDIAERNSTWEVPEYMPGFIAIGDTGSGDVVLMKMNDGDLAVYMVGSGVMDSEFVVQIASSLEDWLDSGLQISNSKHE